MKCPIKINLIRTSPSVANEEQQKGKDDFHRINGVITQVQTKID